MQTFLPLPNFKDSARMLDWQRLGKQRVEAYQILKALADPTYGWQSHPAVLMWRGYEAALRMYFNAVSREWIQRGYQHNMGFFPDEPFIFPPWFGNPIFHYSHLSMLYQKRPDYYPPVKIMDYYWPVRKEMLQ